VNEVTFVTVTVAKSSRASLPNRIPSAGIKRLSAKLVAVVGVTILYKGAVTFGEVITMLPADPPPT
jgi:hypothetical protein